MLRRFLLARDLRQAERIASSGKPAGVSDACKRAFAAGVLPDIRCVGGNALSRCLPVSRLAEFHDNRPAMAGFIGAEYSG